MKAGGPIWKSGPQTSPSFLVFPDTKMISRMHVLFIHLDSEGLSILHSGQVALLLATVTKTSGCDK